jgi:hypothetical protein
MKQFIFIVFATITIPEVRGQPEVKNDSLQIAFLLDVSGSMDNLIQKAKSQIWRIGSYLGTSTKKGKRPIVEFAIVIYGFDDENDPSKILIGFNSDLDSVVLKLYDIRTGGGNEYCWTTISKSLDSLNWSTSENDLKLIIIAGNESFNQEETDSKKIIQEARKRNVIINTIYCGQPGDADSQEWEKAADLGRGNYFTISLGDSVGLDETFLDKKLVSFNDKLNATYIPFGPMGQKSCLKMQARDKSARIAGAPFFTERMIYKINSSFVHPTWDLVDAYDVDSTILESSLVNAEFNSDAATLKELIKDKKHTRESYKEVIKLRYDMIRKYIGDNKGDKDLDEGIRKIIDKEGRKRGFEFNGTGGL